MLNFGGVCDFFNFSEKKHLNKFITTQAFMEDIWATWEIWNPENSGRKHYVPSTCNAKVELLPRSARTLTLKTPCPAALEKKTSMFSSTPALQWVQKGETHQIQQGKKFWTPISKHKQQPCGCKSCSKGILKINTTHSKNLWSKDFSQNPEATN